MSDELTDALRLAERVLDKPYIDPDGDICLLARQFLRARDEIVALREHAAKCMRVSGCAEARAEALEEAAQVCDGLQKPAHEPHQASIDLTLDAAAFLIRALKDKPHE